MHGGRRSRVKARDEGRRARDEGKGLRLLFFGRFCKLAVLSTLELMPRYFRHYKNGQLYELLHIARIEADPDKKAVVYQAMYGEKEIWIRPYENFFETVVVDGKEVPRFKEED